METKHQRNLAQLRDNGFGVFASGNNAETDARIVKARAAKGAKASYAAHMALDIPAEVETPNGVMATTLDIAADIKARPFNDGNAHIGVIVNNADKSIVRFIDGADINDALSEVGTSIVTLRYTADIPKGESSSVVGNGNVIVRGGKLSAVFASCRFRIDDDAINNAFNPTARAPRTRSMEVINTDDLTALI